MSAITATITFPASMSHELSVETLKMFSQALADTLRRSYSTCFLYRRFPLTQRAASQAQSDVQMEEAQDSGLRALLDRIQKLPFLYKRTIDYITPTPDTAQPLSFPMLDAFLAEFQESYGRVDGLVVNQAGYRAYLGLHHAADQVPCFQDDPMTGRKILTHQGIPIFVNDAILVYGEQSKRSVFQDEEHPEFQQGVSSDTTSLQTSLYAVSLQGNDTSYVHQTPFFMPGLQVHLEHIAASVATEPSQLRGTIRAEDSDIDVKIGRLAGIRVTSTLSTNG